MRARNALQCSWLLLCWAVAVGAQEPSQVATITFAVGQATLTTQQCSQLDSLAGMYPPAIWLYSFEGDHDLLPFGIVSPNASKRLNERLAETRWQAVARCLGVPPLGLVRMTGKNEARIFVQRRATSVTELGDVRPEANFDSLAALRRQLEDQAVAIDVLRHECARPPADTVLAVARLEVLHVRTDKWLAERWWEMQGDLELGLLRVEPAKQRHRPSGATLVFGNGSPAYHPLEVSVRFDTFRFGTENFGVAPAVRWYDWDIRVHYGQDPEASISFMNDANPVYLLGLDLDATPWRGGAVRLKYAGVGAQVHAADRKLISYDQYDLRFDQRLVAAWWLEFEAVYDERFEKSLCYAGGWLAHGWPLKLGTFSIRLGFVEQLDAFAAARAGREDPVGTVSLGLRWERLPRFRR
jgi:hypothetical protein